jgi:hypothetical protein
MVYGWAEAALGTGNFVTDAPDITSCAPPFDEAF